MIITTIFMMTQYLVIIGYIIMIIAIVGIVYLLWKGYRIGQKLRKKTYGLGKDLNNRKVEDYISYIDKVEIPPRKYYWNMLISGYKLVEMDDKINEDLKKQLKIMILSKGILVE